MGFTRRPYFAFHEGDLSNARIIAQADVSDGWLREENVDWDNAVLVDITDPSEKERFADAFFVEYIGYMVLGESVTVWVEIGRGERPQTGPKIAPISDQVDHGGWEDH